MQSQTPAQVYALSFGAVLLLVGIVGFFYEAELTAEEGVRDEVFGVFAVNGWHNLVHVATGALGLLAYGAGALASRQFALGLGVVYVVVAIWGFVIGDGESILSIVPVNTADNVLHAGIGILGLAAGAASAAAPGSTAGTGPAAPRGA